MQDEKKLVYILDRNFSDPNGEHTPSIQSKPNDEHTPSIQNEFDIRIYKSRSTLKKEIQKKSPDLVMIDLFSLTTQKNILQTEKQLNQPEEQPNKTEEQPNKTEEQPNKKSEISKKSLTVPILTNSNDHTEQMLSALQYVKEECRNAIKKTHHTSGIEDLSWLKSQSDIAITFPIAIFSRHGKSLLTTEEIIKISALGAYLTWKVKESNPTTDLTNREIESIESIIDLHKKQTAQLPLMLKDLQTELKTRERNHRKISISHKFSERFFILFTGLSAISNLDWMIKKEITSHSKIIFSLLFPEVFSVLALLSVIFYTMLKFILKKHEIEISQTFTEIENLIAEIVNQKNKS